jgi:hypothetical protein
VEGATLTPALVNPNIKGTVVKLNKIASRLNSIDVALLAYVKIAT